MPLTKINRQNRAADRTSALTIEQKLIDANLEEQKFLLNAVNQQLNTLTKEKQAIEFEIRVLQLKRRNQMRLAQGLDELCPLIFEK